MLFNATATRVSWLSHMSLSSPLSINAFAVRPSAFGKVAVATSSSLMSLLACPHLVRGASTNYENDGNNDDNNNHNDGMAFAGLKDKKLTEAATVLDIEKLQLIMTKGLFEIKNEVGVIKNEVVAVKNEFNGQLVEIKNEIFKMDGKFVAVKNGFNGQLVEIKNEIVKMDEKLVAVKDQAVAVKDEVKNEIVKSKKELNVKLNKIDERFNEINSSIFVAVIAVVGAVVTTVISAQSPINLKK